MNSFTVFTSITAGLTVSTLDTSTSGATGVKSASASNGRVLYSAGLMPCVAAVPSSSV
ncbi:hypothetical protein D3C80_1749190 [compost metagenome]